MQTSLLTPEIEVFTFEDVEEFSESGMIITRVEGQFQEKDDELSRNPFQGYTCKWNMKLSNFVKKVVKKNQ